MIRILSWIPGIYPKEINKLPLPATYLQLERMGRWRVPGLDRLTEVFGEATTSPCFYNRDHIGVENKDLAERLADDEYFIGKLDDQHSPGNIRPSKVVFVGDLGVDRPIALDYRDNYYEPRVIYLRCTPNGSRWVRIADTFEELAQLLGLTGLANGR